MSQPAAPVAGGHPPLAPGPRPLLARRPDLTGSPLTRSTDELDVMRLIARGLTNAEFAAELIVAQATIKSHDASLLRKLGARDRVQIVIRAYESGVIRQGH